MSEQNSNELAIGTLLLCAGTNEIVKRVISAFDHKSSKNHKSLAAFNLDMLEPCAEFLDIQLTDGSGIKLFTKVTLVNRIIFELQALLPSECLECNETYVNEFNSDHKPLFHCHMCYRGSHDCSAITGIHDALASASINLLSSHVWLCKSCKDSSNPFKPRKSRNRLDSINKTDPSLSHLRDNSSCSTPANTPNQSAAYVSATEAVDESELSRRLDTVKKDRTCPKYMRGVCPHGLRGKKEVEGRICEFEHPKYCMKYCRYGSKKKFGCSRGSNCKFLHPVLCKFSVKKKLCIKSDCTYIHLKGTRRKEGEPENHNRHTKKKPNEMDKSESSDLATLKNHFLEMNRLVEVVDKMQTNFQQQITEIRSSLLHQVPYHHIPRLPLHHAAMYPPSQHPYHPQFHPAQGIQRVPTIPPASC